MELYIVSTPIGNLQDMTVRGTETLKFCDLVLCEDTRISSKLFSLLGIKKPLLAYHKFNEKEMSEKLDELFEKNEKIALISDAGTPAICDPGSFIIKRARELGAKVYAVPGASALSAAASLSGEKESNFIFIGFFPRENKGQKEIFEKIKKSGFSHFIFYESPNRIIKTLELTASALDVLEVRVFNDLTKKFEREYVGKAEAVIEELCVNENAGLGEYVVSVSLKKCKTQKEKPISEAGLLVDYIMKNNVSVKEAIEKLSEKGVNKNKLKAAAIKIKEKKW